MKKIVKYRVCNFGIYMAGFCMVMGAIDRISKQDYIKQIGDLGLHIVDDAGKEVVLKLPPILPKFKKVNKNQSLDRNG